MDLDVLRPWESRNDSACVLRTITKHPLSTERDSIPNVSARPNAIAILHVTTIPMRYSPVARYADHFRYEHRTWRGRPVLALDSGIPIGSA